MYICLCLAINFLSTHLSRFIFSVCTKLIESNPPPTTTSIPSLEYLILEDYTRKLFKEGGRIAESQGLILVDTKYEFGKNSKGEIVVIDEIHTPDSSRYFYLDSYKELQNSKLPQKQLSKEFVRQWLISEGFQGKEAQKIPHMSDDYVNIVSDRYIELYERITGEKFVKEELNEIDKRIYTNISNYLKE